MLSEKETTSLSKFLSLILRHKPETIHLIQDNFKI
jgi:RNA:NAD 2'-phosphotransferase (TPT1/KptA family)